MSTRIPSDVAYAQADDSGSSRKSHTRRRARRIASTHTSSTSECSAALFPDADLADAPSPLAKSGASAPASDPPSGARWTSPGLAPPRPNSSFSSFPSR